MGADCTICHASPPEYVAQTLASGDLDRDGWNDLVIGMGPHEAADPPARLEIWLNHGDGSFRNATASHLPQTWVPDIGGVRRAFVADVNADDWPDLVVSGGIFECLTFLFVNQGSARFVQQLFLDDPQRCGDLFPFDADGNERLDLYRLSGSKRRGSSRISEAVSRTLAVQDDRIARPVIGHDVRSAFRKPVIAHLEGRFGHVPALSQEHRIQHLPGSDLLAVLGDDGQGVGLRHGREDAGSLRAGRVRDQRVTLLLQPDAHEIL